MKLVSLRWPLYFTVSLIIIFGACAEGGDLSETSRPSCEGTLSDRLKQIVRSRLDALTGHPDYPEVARQVNMRGLFAQNLERDLPEILEALAHKMETRAAVLHEVSNIHIDGASVRGNKESIGIGGDLVVGIYYPDLKDTALINNVPSPFAMELFAFCKRHSLKCRLLKWLGDVDAKGAKAPWMNINEDGSAVTVPGASEIGDRAPIIFDISWDLNPSPYEARPANLK